ncbi:MAG: ribose 5-phosphate isomerase B [Anaerolineales bacterium]
MRIAVGTDHGGYLLKETIIAVIRETGHEALDFGTDSEDPVDYPDFAEKVGSAIKSGKADRGIVICGSGVGICIAANKMQGIWAAICHDSYSAKQGVEHDNMNVLCLGGRIIGTELAKLLVQSFLDARFVGEDQGQERHKRRVEKVKKLEKEGKQS